MKSRSEDFERIEIQINEEIPEYRRSLWKDVCEAFKAKKSAIICLIFLMIIVIAALCAPLSPYDPDALDASNKLQGISAEHWLGTDEYGRDYFTRALYGGQVSIVVGLMTMVVAIGIGTLIGTISGYVGGVVDAVLMRFTDVFMSLPGYLIAMILNLLLKPNVMTLILVLALFSWPSVTRVTRAETMTLKQRDFVCASKNLGASDGYVIFYHIIPNMVGQISVAATLGIAHAILTESFLSYIGLGVQLPRASWGSMLQGAQKYLMNVPLLAIVPGILILLTVLSFNVIGDVLRAALEPRGRK